MKHLDISGYTFHPSESKIFTENLKKLPHLVSLNSSHFQFEDFKEFTSQIHKLKSLKKISFPYIHPEESAELIKQIELNSLSGTPNELMKILKNGSFKSFKISKIITDKTNYDSLLQKLTEAGFWNQLESFEYDFLSL